jgi:uncharacterized OB-fold protein
MSTEQGSNICTGDVVQVHHLPLADLAIDERQDFMVADDGVVKLIASRSASSDSLSFPQRSICQVTGARDMSAEPVGPHGSLYSFSTIHISATRQTPYTLGYVDFESGLRVLAEVRGASSDALICDLPVTLACDATGWWVEPLPVGSAQ